MKSLEFTVPCFNFVVIVGSPSPRVIIIDELVLWILIKGNICNIKNKMRFFFFLLLMNTTKIDPPWILMIPQLVGLKFYQCPFDDIKHGFLARVLILRFFSNWYFSVVNIELLITKEAAMFTLSIHPFVTDITSYGWRHA